MSETGKDGPRALRIPPGAFEDADSVEILRAWIASEGLEVSFLKAWDEPDNWGVFLADLARHAARAYTQDGVLSEAEALNRIRRAFEAEWTKPSAAGAGPAAKH